MSVEEKFLAAVDIINNLPSDGTFQPSTELMLKLYAYYKQATEGPCYAPKPSIWNYSTRSKWSAWSELENMPKSIAMEKYVEELTKVIETMSYNETVSRFMSLIGPFYEVVSMEDSDVESEKKISGRSQNEFPYPVKNLNELHEIKDECLHVESLESIRPPSSQMSHFFSSKMRSFKKHSNSDLFPSAFVTQQNAINAFKPKTAKKSFMCQQDLLILAVINLKSSLEDIVNKFDHLHNLACSARLDSQSENMEEAKEWELGVGGTAFALLWPIAVHLWTRNF